MHGLARLRFYHPHSHNNHQTLSVRFNQWKSLHLQKLCVHLHLLYYRQGDFMSLCVKMRKKSQCKCRNIKIRESTSFGMHIAQCTRINIAEFDAVFKISLFFIGLMFLLLFFANFHHNGMRVLEVGRLTIQLKIVCWCILQSTRSVVMFFIW